MSKFTEKERELLGLNGRDYPLYTLPSARGRLNAVHRRQMNAPSIEGQTIGERICNLRQSRTVSQHDLLEAIGRPKSDQSWLSRIESGEREISVKDLKAIAAHFKVSIDELVP